MSTDPSSHPISPAVITWQHILDVTRVQPLLIRDPAGLEKMVAANRGAITLAQLLEWQRDKYAMRV